MEKGERDTYIEGIVERVNQQMRDHAAKLHTLETEHGFSLDVATDIYGLSLLDHTKGSQEIIDRWKAFYDALASGQTDTILLCQVRKELQPGCHGFGAKEKYQHPVRSTLVRTDETSHLVYHDAVTEGDTTTAARITLENVQTAVVEPHGTHSPVEWVAGGLVLAQPYDTKLRLGDITSAAFNTGPLGVGNDHLVIMPISQHKDLLDAANQLDSCGTPMAYFALRPYEQLLQFEKPPVDSQS